MSPAIITGLPRSRTSWWANLLTFGESVVYHDPFCTSEDGVCKAVSFKRVVQSLRAEDWQGISDAAVLLFWRSLQEEFPAAKWVVCKRDLNDVLDSCRKIMPDLPTAGIGALAKELEILIEEMNPKIVNFDDISPITCFEVAEYLQINIGSSTRVRQLCDFNVQVHPSVLQKRIADLICQPVTGATKQTK